MLGDGRASPIWNMNVGASISQNLAGGKFGDAAASTPMYWRRSSASRLLIWSAMSSSFAAPVLDLLACAHFTRSGRLRSGIDPDKNLFHCFGCGVGGDGIRFVELFHGLSFLDAATLVASRFGIDVDAPIPAVVRDRLRLENEWRMLIGGLLRSLMPLFSGVPPLRPGTPDATPDRRTHGGNPSRAPELHPGEDEVQWRVLADLSAMLRHLETPYMLLGFGSREAREGFARRIAKSEPKSSGGCWKRAL